MMFIVKLKITQFFRKLVQSKEFFGVLTLIIGITWTWSITFSAYEGAEMVTFVRASVSEFIRPKSIVYSNRDILPVIEVANAAVEAPEIELPRTVQEKVLAAFPDDPVRALRVAECESQFDSSRVGDTHLGFYHKRETLGYSYGLFQIRSGGNERGMIWSRPEKAGLSVEEWAKNMLDIDKNIREARKIYDESGKSWLQWTCGKNL